MSADVAVVVAAHPEEVQQALEEHGPLLLSCCASILSVPALTSAGLHACTAVYACV